MREAQISIEYLIILGVVSLLLIIPAAIFLSSFTQSSVYSTLTSEQISSLGDGITKSAKQVYYLGYYSKKQAVLPIPEQVEKFYLLKITRQSDSTEHYFVFLQVLYDEGSHKFFFPSDAPLVSLEGTHVTKVTTVPEIPECVDPANVCEAYVFGNSVLLPGKKQFTFETINQAGKAMVRVTPDIS